MKKLALVFLSVLLVFIVVWATADASLFEYVKPMEKRILWGNNSHFDVAADCRFYKLPDGKWLVLGFLECTNKRDKYAAMVEADLIICPPSLVEDGKLGKMHSLDWATYTSTVPQYRDPEVLPGDACFVAAVELNGEPLIFEPHEKKTVYFEDVINCEDPEARTAYFYTSGHVNLPENE